MPDVIYTVTVMRKGDDRVQRTWGWFPDLATAERVVLNNETDIFEFFYDYALIETVQPGICVRNSKIQWYRAIYQDKSCEYLKEEPYPRVERIEEPEEYMPIINFSMG